MLHGEDTASQIENGLHLPTFTSDAHGNLRTKIETGERDYTFFSIITARITTPCMYYGLNSLKSYN